tara:strand:+ start:1 stop:1422 length:1422 start_codon:yes stop_codon:yes gene_type:complete
MGFSYGSKGIVTEGLVLCLDAGNLRSFPQSGVTWYDISNAAINNGTLSHEGIGWPTGTSGSDVDGNAFPIVRLGTKLWMAENLRTTKYSDGTDIWGGLTGASYGEWADATIGAYASYDEYNVGEQYLGTYGYLYNWYAVDGRWDIGNGYASKSLAPEGWHVPLEQEWKDLEIELGMSEYHCYEVSSNYIRGETEGVSSKLAGSASLWDAGALKDHAEFGTSGLNFVPAGRRRSDNGGYDRLGERAHFWSFDKYTPDAYGSSEAPYRTIDHNEAGIYRATYYARQGYSVRCVMEENVPVDTMTFDGTNDYVEVNTTFNYITDKLMVSGWIYPRNTNGGAMSVLGKYNTSTNKRSYAFYIDSNAAPNDNKFDFWVSDDGDNRHSISAEIEENKWQFFVGTFDNGVMKIYIDGELNIAGEAPFTTIYRSSIPFQVGHIYQAASHFDGKIANVSVYNKALTETEIRQNYNTLKWRFQ